MKSTIYHQSRILNWVEPSQIDNPKTLVIGSFNPYSEGGKLVDYYYGRESNHFWRSIAFEIGQQENYFFDSEFGMSRKLEVMNKRFCCLDCIDSITFESTNNLVLEAYLKENIFSNFSDQKIWTSKTGKNDCSQINLARSYNLSIPKILTETNSIKRVINTMGQNRIRLNEVHPKEKKLGNSGFNAYISNIATICNKKTIHFETISMSPSEYAIKNGYTDKLALRKWLRDNLYL